MMDEERLKKALLDPPAVFERSAEVLADATLTNEQKVEILRRWEYDANEVSVAEEEGMPANDGQVLQQIMCALRDLVREMTQSGRRQQNKAVLTGGHCNRRNGGLSEGESAQKAVQHGG